MALMGAQTSLGQQLSMQLTTAGAEVIHMDAPDGGISLPEGEITGVVCCPGSVWEVAFQNFGATLAGVRQAAQIAAQTPDARLVLFSSAAVFDGTGHRPGLRPDMTPGAGETAPARAWLTLESLVQRTLGARGLVLRTSDLVGTSAPGAMQLAARARRGAWPLMRGGRAVTDPLHVADAAAAGMAALTAPAARLRAPVMHLSGDRPLAVREIVETLCLGMGAECRWRTTPWPIARLGALLRCMTGQDSLAPYLVRRLAFTRTLDTRRARSQLDWAAQRDPVAGLREMLEPSLNRD